ncbi:translocation/assembly module TamB domain-containing protein [Prevotella sp. AGR2160]|uniref:translocation/assembly module TamB domain-containing protein n=1 Tax=Prevotella sp. AGR2160 TaxID=1280674 RepID=UPI000427528F|nr:translocation/assembly module TamB domain-containing protein [Prevotella sp. AGR2160]
MTAIKHTIRVTIWVIVALFLTIPLLFHVPAVQRWVGSTVAHALSEKFGTTVTVERVDPGLFNRLIVDHLMMLDQQGDTLLAANRVAVKVDILPLFQNRISISSAQLFGLDARLSKANATAKPNYQFVLDSLASKDTTKHTPLDLHISTLILRHGSIRYDRHDKALSASFNPNHLWLREISSHIVIPRITDNSVTVEVKKLSMREQSGLDIRKCHVLFTTTKGQDTRIEHFALELPHSQLTLGPVRIDNSGHWQGDILPSVVTLSDLKPFLPQLSHFKTPLHLAVRLHGNKDGITAERLHLYTANGLFNLSMNGSVRHFKAPSWQAEIRHLTASGSTIKFIFNDLGKQLRIPEAITRLGNVYFQGQVAGRSPRTPAERGRYTGLAALSVNGVLHSSAGNAHLNAWQRVQQFGARLQTAHFDIGRVLANDKLGTLATAITISGTFTPRDYPDMTARGLISRFTYDGYTYRDISLNAVLHRQILSGKVTINDPRASFHAEGHYALPTRTYTLTAMINRLMPGELLKEKIPEPSFALKDILLRTEHDGYHTSLQVKAPFADAEISGHYNYTDLVASVMTIIKHHLPTAPGLTIPKQKPSAAYTFHTTITDDHWLHALFGIPLRLNGTTFHAEGLVDTHLNRIELIAEAPSLQWKDTELKNINVTGHTVDNSLRCTASVALASGPSFTLHADAAKNRLGALLDYNNGSTTTPIRGSLSTHTQFYRSERGRDAAHIVIHPSELMIKDTTWNIEPGDILFEKDRLQIDHFALGRGNQHIMVSGQATNNAQDSVFVDLQQVDVDYILNLVNFHSVDFGGKASGRVYITSAFRHPEAAADLRVEDFTFEEGEMGTLQAHASYNQEKGRIELQSTAVDGPGATTHINGYISPAHDAINLAIKADGTPLAFMNSFGSGFLSDVKAKGYGEVDLVGKLSAINLVGDLNATGSLHIKSTNTDYWLDHAPIHCIPNEIIFTGDTIRDIQGHKGLVTGAIHHHNLARLTYDLQINAQNLLCYNRPTFEDDSYCGVVWATGTCKIHGVSGETDIDIHVRPEKGSVFSYNTASTGEVGSSDFIHWNDATPKTDTIVTDNGLQRDNVPDIPSDLHINFLIDCTPDLTLKVITDPTTNDYISLNGEGSIKANWFNKGSFDMFGNYNVDRGIYRLTVQNVIRKDFHFQPGGTIAFGGDPFKAALNLQAVYTVNSVPLSDLQLGNSFSKNNIKVNCLMNISGTTGQPHVDFGLDTPTLDNDARQMVFSVINGEEEMNQQVLYLLAVGRFMTQGSNNALAEQNQQQSQTSLAMQSILSGTLSQQLNNVLSTVMNNTNFNVGANISTGDEGFNNAEYEGILNGSLFNNRLLFNGQFGYRDSKNNASPSFIGDFDLRYLLTPNGNFAIRVYNQTNDRYFTRNSLTTQGLGFIIKKDFNGFRDLFRKSKKVKK